MALFAYTMSQLVHGFTYFMMLETSGAVTTGIMQSLRAVCVFLLSSILYCSYQESQCFDTKRGVATLIVVNNLHRDGLFTHPLNSRFVIGIGRHVLFLGEKHINSNEPSW